MRIHPVKRFGLLPILIHLFLSGCASQSEPPREESHPAKTLVFVANDGDGTVSVIAHGGEGNRVVQTIPVGIDPGGLGFAATEAGHLFLTVSGSNSMAVFDPSGEDVALTQFLPTGAGPNHNYLDPTGRMKLWAMNDGDPAAGIDTLTTECKDTGMASVTVVEDKEGGEEGDDHLKLLFNGDGHGGGEGSGETGATVLKTICVGKGHHKAAFGFPTDDHPGIPKRVFISNIKDGTISVIDNDPASPAYLTRLSTIDLCDSDGESKQGKPPCDADLSTPNNSRPHGIDLSPHSGKIYNANVGYGTVVVVDPAFDPANPAAAIVQTLDVGFSNKTHASPDGHFVVVKGTDTTSDPNHVIGRLTVINTEDHTFTRVDLSDVHPDDFAFTPDEEKLYVVSATAGSEAQKANLKNNIVLVFDFDHETGSLTLAKEIPVGVADHGHRSLAIHVEEGEAEHLFVPNPHDGTVSVIDAKSESVVETVAVGPEPGSIFVFSTEEADEGGHTH